MSDIPRANDALFEGARSSLVAGLRLAIEPRPQGATCVCISPRSVAAGGFARENSVVPRFPGSSRRHLSSRAGSLEATANPLSSFSFFFHFSPAQQQPSSPSSAFYRAYPCAEHASVPLRGSSTSNPSRRNHASAETDGRKKLGPAPGGPIEIF